MTNLSFNYYGRNVPSYFPWQGGASAEWELWGLGSASDLLLICFHSSWLMSRFGFLSFQVGSHDNPGTVPDFLFQAKSTWEFAKLQCLKPSPFPFTTVYQPHTILTNRSFLDINRKRLPGWTNFPGAGFCSIKSPFLFFVRSFVFSSLPDTAFDNRIHARDSSHNSLESWMNGIRKTGFNGPLLIQHFRLVKSTYIAIWMWRRLCRNEML